MLRDATYFQLYRDILTVQLSPCERIITNNITNNTINRRYRLALIHVCYATLGIQTFRVLLLWFPPKSVYNLNNFSDRMKINTTIVLNFKNNQYKAAQRKHRLHLITYIIVNILKRTICAMFLKLITSYYWRAHK